MIHEAMCFTEDELAAALGMVMPEVEARAAARDLRRAVPEAGGQRILLADVIIDLLCLVSDDCARRIRELRGPSEGDPAAARTRLRDLLAGSGPLQGT